ncbi:molecular chaperone DnaJ [Natrarchaeobius halalkaliphilus]|uniref:Molecular chaperone DnaJ n=1 Tax=Natrarchaeobius halalkaliphilus TaxID=1679091 RepID=A0A3N6P3G5_9EURY|nr:J domain-containing protein [Natrarchaeobius halalkaliphilus]RQG89825.1 molecular chaperone DnaJ [Natrarchaeobius halalkaliphilus]
MAENYYEVLEIEPDATRTDIEDAYRRRVLETHPDHNDDPDAIDEFQRVSTAKSILTDGDERARYDRLGHDAYVRLGRYAGPTSSSESPGQRTDDRRSSESAGMSSDRRTGSKGTHRRHRQQRSNRRTNRQRNHRQHRQQRTATGRSAESNRSFDPGASSETTEDTNSEASNGETNSAFRYTVQDWDEDVDLEWEGRSIDHSTAVTVTCLWILYPVFVYSSLTPMVSPILNGLLLVCTLGVIGYLLTMPRVAMLVFGSLSVLFPLGVGQLQLIEPLSLHGGVSVAFVWIPFGYAVAVWWALRP